MTRFTMVSLIVLCLVGPFPVGAQQNNLDQEAVSAVTRTYTEVGKTTKPEAGGTVASTLEAISPYRIGIEDVVSISVWRNPELTQQERVRPDGRITLKLVGDVSVVGMSPAEAQALLVRRYREFVPDAEVTVTLQEINSFKVYVLGRVSHSGEVSVRSSITALQALAVAGGFAPYAKTRKIKIFRKVGRADQILLFNYPAVVEGQAGDIQLQPGDRVIVP